MSSSRREFLKTSGIAMAGFALQTDRIRASSSNSPDYICRRPQTGARKFTSKAVESLVLSIKQKIQDPKLAWMFENCFPNTLDTTVESGILNGNPDTFVITGDIPAMWLRDSTAQIWPYLPLVNEDPELKRLIAGVIHRQTHCILIDPYANAFNKTAKNGEWMTDLTDMKPELHERKWEIDSLCYTVRLAHEYWKSTGDKSVFNDHWQKAAELIYQTFVQQQRKKGPGPYKFERNTTRQLDTLSNNGYGQPLKPVGLINSSFRPSDDATTYGFLIPSNLFAVLSLRQMAEISRQVTLNKNFAEKCQVLADEVNLAVQNFGVFEHPKYGKVFSFEVDGFGNATFMDDANVPSLLALPYLGCVEVTNPVYQNTRKLIWSEDNPYFFKGETAEGIGGPHIGYDMIWPMSIIMKAMTSNNDQEIKWCIKTLRDTDANTGFMHESFHMNDPKKFTRSWFAWANTLFGELIIKLVNTNKTDLLSV